MAKKHTLPDAIFPTIRKLAENLSLIELAIAYDVSAITVQRLLSRFGTTLTQVRREAQMNVILPLLQNGTYVHVIARKLKVTPDRVYKIIALEGYTVKGVKK